MNYLIISKTNLSWAYIGSGLTLHLVLRRQLVISEVAPCKGSCYFPVPEELTNSIRKLIIVQNNDNECFR